MKKLLIVALLLSFLVGNAQQERQQYGTNSTREPVQLYNGINPGYPSEVDLNKSTIRKTDNDAGYKSEVNQYRYSIRKTNNINLGYPSEIDQYRHSISKPDNINLGFPSEVYIYRHSIRKPD